MCNNFKFYIDLSLTSAIIDTLSCLMKWQKNGGIMKMCHSEYLLKSNERDFDWTALNAEKSNFVF